MPASQSLEWIAREISDRLAQVVNAMTEDRCSAVWHAAEHVDASWLWWNFAMSGAGAGFVWLGAPPAAAAQAGARVLAAAGVDDDPETARATFLEVLSQALSAAGQAMSAQIGGAVDFGPAAQSSAPASEAFFRIELSGCGDSPVSLAGAVSESILSLLARPDQVQAVPLLQSSPANSPVKAGPPPALQLLMDVELPVSVSFGRAQLQIRDVVKLASGSIVELNRGVTEPVEVIVNNCVIARGEVVVVEGNYGVRIDEIISPDERLRTLR